MLQCVVDRLTGLCDDERDASADEPNLRRRSRRCDKGFPSRPLRVYHRTGTYRRGIASEPPPTYLEHMRVNRRICIDVKMRPNTAIDGLSGPEDCNCLAARQAARHITQFYDQFLAPSGLRTTQFSILAKLSRLGPMTINALAADLVMDRTTLGRNLLPLERDGLIAVQRGKRDRRSKEVRLTQAGAARFRAGVNGWTRAQKQFTAAFGANRTVELRALLHAVAATELEFP
jgi:DNA-binding MarR family transcriptional regulator